MPKITKNCEQCQKEYSRYPSVIGRFCSLECKKSFKGLYRHTEEHKKALSKRMRGNKFAVGMTPWSKGKKMPAHIVESAAKVNRGKKLSEAHKRAISKTHKKRGVGNYMKKAWTLERMKSMSIKGITKQQTMKEPTSIEKAVYDELKDRGLLFEKQYLVNGKFLVDAYIPSLNLVIECDGDYWHSLDRVIKRDRAKNAYLTKCGYGLARFTETDIRSGEYLNELGELLA